MKITEISIHILLAKSDGSGFWKSWRHMLPTSAHRSCTQ
uniref:Uncharacterized protein n=1 Tax=Anguilla anguilla TaxID=7936 RepID=A0A0E9W488_ANGAN